MAQNRAQPDIWLFLLHFAHPARRGSKSHKDDWQEFCSAIGQLRCTLRLPDLFFSKERSLEMKHVLILVCAAVALLGLTGASDADIMWDFQQGASTSALYAPTDTFNNGSSIWSWTGNYAFVLGSKSNVYAAPTAGPVTDATKYVTVPEDVNDTPRSATISFGTAYSYFGMWWGSVDTYNSITFYLNGTQVGTLTGSQVLAHTGGATGSQTDLRSNGFLKVYGNDLTFNRIVFSSTNYAMEMDNFTVAPIPEPASMLLLGSGLIGFAGLRRRIRK
ncbi:MAG: PEP-CTERM sorting domain-containing protein [Syntrophobacteraceae bacterium]|nr:VPLPA-CTERM sorting domain-containing protein [Desulfobacteraceae bacterium]